MGDFPRNSGSLSQMSELIGEWFKDPLNKQAYSAVDSIKEKLTNYHQPHDFMTADFDVILNMVSAELHKVTIENAKLLRVSKAARRAVYHCTLDTGIFYWQDLANAVFELEADDREEK